MLEEAAADEGWLAEGVLTKFGQVRPAAVRAEVGRRTYPGLISIHEYSDKR